MALGDITLPFGMRQNLISLQLVSALQARTTERLATGKRVNSAVDDPTAYFTAQNHLARANQLAGLKDSMGEAVQTVNAASEGVDGITTLIEQAKGLAASARGGSASERSSLAAQFDDLMTQIDQLAGDSSYKGTNLLGSDSLTVQFNEDNSSNLTITGFDASSSGLGIGAAANDWVDDTDIDAAISDLDSAQTTLRSNSSTLASNLSVVSTRQDFTTNLIATLETGAENLTLADMNEESANMLALQTRQQLGISALSIASQTQQSVLSLF
ncbi:MAG: flagellin [Candidatus Eisenbacteria bacterium]|nr:flagellin [Candidatus Latescibacterota bacterium]MBD3300964.1 flagellin [Candidatus Eisenbacteria bacterium]